MEAIEAIMTRRSVRRFEHRQIPDAVLEKIIRAGTYAPSGLALQPWAFVIVHDKTFLHRVSEYCKPILLSLLKNSHDGMSDAFRALVASPGYSIFYQAPTVILLIGKTDSRFRDIDCSLCAENMMLAAHAMGIGSCWVGSAGVAFDNRELLAGFRIPPGFSPVATIAFGYPAELPEVHDKIVPNVTWVR